MIPFLEVSLDDSNASKYISFTLVHETFVSRVERFTPYVSSVPRFENFCGTSKNAKFRKKRLKSLEN